MDRAPAEVSRDAQVAELVHSVLRALGEAVPEDTVEEEVRRGLEMLDDARIKDFVPVLTERYVKDKLRDRRLLNGGFGAS